MFCVKLQGESSLLNDESGGAGEDLDGKKLHELNFSCVLNPHPVFNLLCFMKSGR